MPKRRFIKLPSGQTVPIVENKQQPEYQVSAEEMTVPELGDEKIEKTVIEPELIPEDDDMEDLSDMFESSLDRDIVQHGIETVTQVSDEDVMGDEDIEPASGEPMQDLFEVSEEDIMGEGVDDLTQGEEPEQLDDLLEVSDEDIIGESIKQPEIPPTMQPRKLIKKYRRTNRPYMPPPPSSLGGMRT